MGKLGAGGGVGVPGVPDLEGQQDLTVGLLHDWGKQRLHSWRAHTKSCVYQDPGERSSDPQETEPDPPAVLKGLLQKCEVAAAHSRDRGTGRSSSRTCPLA